MRSPDEHFTNPNAFDAGYLERLGAEDEPPNTEAETAGPWRVETAGEGWACWAEGADEPYATFERWDAALMAAAALPGSGRPGRFELIGDGPPFRVLERGRPIGTLPVWNEELVAAMSALAELAASPASLADLLEAAGDGALRRAGQLLARRLAEGERSRGREAGR